MTKKRLYFSLCDKADKILIDSGIRKICTKCSTGGKKGWSKRPYWMENGAGCCNGYGIGSYPDRCKYLGKNGCTVKCLSCKLFLCNKFKMMDMIDKIGKMREWEKIERLARLNDFLGYRQPAYQNPELLVKKQK